MTGSAKNFFCLFYIFYVKCIYYYLFIFRQVDDESYSWGVQKSLGKDFYKDDINSSGQFVSVLNISLKHIIFIMCLILE